MLTLLALIGMTIHQTRQEKREDTAPLATKSDAEFVETLVPGPNDTQALEESQAENLFQAVTDKAPLAAEEMPSYWRLMRWSMTQTFDELWERARKDRYLTHFAEAPQKHRGELVGLKLSLRRTASFEAGKNSAGAKTVYEAWGVTDESRGNFYCLVFYDKPPELPIHPDVHEEAQFVGYFHKLLTYQDPLDKTRWAPLLIGRVKWRENPARVALQRTRHVWSYWLWGSLAVVAVVVVWTNRYLDRGRAQLPPPQEVDHASIERWLETGMTEDASPTDGPASRSDDAGVAGADADRLSRPGRPSIFDSHPGSGDGPVTSE
ncbi:MAG: hypothetical protein AABP62_08975 [Planctomycetota bacterium]